MIGKIFIFTLILIISLLLYNLYIINQIDNNIIQINDDIKQLNNNIEQKLYDELDELFIYGPHNASTIYESIAYSPNTWIYSTNENEINRTTKKFNQFINFY